MVVETIARIRREHFVQGKAIKAIERDLKISRNTVRKVIRSEATAFSYDRRSQPRPKLGPWTDELDRLLAANEAKSKRTTQGVESPAGAPGKPSHGPR